jgi:hypothetical protein
MTQQMGFAPDYIFARENGIRDPVQLHQRGDVLARGFPDANGNRFFLSHVFAFLPGDGSRTGSTLEFSEFYSLWRRQRHTAMS